MLTCFHNHSTYTHTKTLKKAKKKGNKGKDMSVYNFEAVMVLGDDGGSSGRGGGAFIRVSKTRY